ncbi:SLC13 family permease [Porticoccus sp. GXU_MW_L64]
MNNKTDLVPGIGLYAGPVIAVVLLLVGAPDDLQNGADSLPQAWVVLALLSLMAVWWVTEAVPIPVTSLLPLIVLPLSGINTMAQAATPYMHPIVVLLLGGFIFAKAIEQWGLHERIALNVVARSGNSPARLIGGFMLAAAGLSMWISNSATSIMMMPIALSVAAVIEPDNSERPAFTLALLLGIAYACSIGGLGTPVGTPTNLIIIGYLNDQTGQEIGFSQWMRLGLPMVAVMLPLAWYAMTRWVFKMPKVDAAKAHHLVADRLNTLGKMSVPEKRTLMVFAAVAALWVFRRPLNELELVVGDSTLKPLAGLTDPMTAIIAVLLCFLVSAGGKSGEKGNAQKLLSWQAAETIPWGVLLLFGGGMSLAQAIASTGLSAYIGQSLSVLAELPLPVLMLLIAAAVLALTEVTSNIATASALMPVLGAVAIETGVPLVLMAAPVALAASCAFMLPMATGPNAVAFSTGRVSLMTMAKAGLRINLIAVVVITAVAYFLAPAALG